MANLTEDFIASAELNEKLCFGRAWPLPRLSQAHKNEADTYEVVVVGAGPCGLLLTVELARLGLTDDSLLCIDAKEEGTKVGHADGVNARSLEILRTLGLEAEIRRDGNPFSTRTVWGPSEHTSGTIELKVRVPFHYSSAIRYEQLKTMHQGRIERIFKSDLQRYSARGVQYCTSVQKVWLDENLNCEYPVHATLEQAGNTKTIRTKYLIGADGAHSMVRKSMNIDMSGDITDRVWGVVDFVPDTNFPDIRRVVNIEGKAAGGAALIVPRERLSNKVYPVRLYIDMTEYDELGRLTNGLEKSSLENEAAESKTTLQKKKAEITVDTILKKGASLMIPYRFGMKKDTQPFWWASYSIGQRLAENFVVSDADQTPRIFLAGDACHTHTPLQGQGMNISMQDSHNLAWKLAYALFGLTPDPSSLLSTYESERRSAASKVVFFDKRWNVIGISPEQRLEEVKNQVLGTTVEHDASILVGEKAEEIEITGQSNPVIGKDYNAGMLRTGRRLLNVRVRRYADGTAWDIHDDLLADGRYRVIVICSEDFPNSEGRSLLAVKSVCGTLIENFPVGMVEAIVLQPDMDPAWGFDELPACIKDEAEMRLHCASQEIYDAYGVDRKRGALVLVRPDGMVGAIANLENTTALRKFLEQVLVTRSSSGKEAGE